MLISLIALIVCVLAAGHWLCNGDIYMALFQLLLALVNLPGTIALFVKR